MTQQQETKMNFDELEFEDLNFGPKVKEVGNLTVSVGKARGGDKVNLSIMMKLPFATENGYSPQMPLGFQMAPVEGGFYFRLPKIEASHSKLHHWGKEKNLLRVMFSNVKDPGLKKGRFVFQNVELANEAIIFKLDEKANVSEYIRKQIVSDYENGSPLEELNESFGLDEELIQEVLIEEKAWRDD